MSSGYYRGNLSRMIEDAKAAFAALSPEEQAAHREEQRKSWVRGETAMGSDADEAREREEYRKSLPRDETGLYPKGSTMTVMMDEAATLPTMVPSPQGMGFTGNECTHCGSTRMLQTGHCETCQDCGETSACS